MVPQPHNDQQAQAPHPAPGQHAPQAPQQQQEAPLQGPTLATPRALCARHAGLPGRGVAWAHPPSAALRSPRDPAHEPASPCPACPCPACPCPASPCPACPCPACPCPASPCPACPCPACPCPASPCPGIPLPRIPLPRIPLPRIPFRNCFVALQQAHRQAPPPLGTAPPLRLPSPLGHGHAGGGGVGGSGRQGASEPGTSTATPAGMGGFQVPPPWPPAGAHPFAAAVKVSPSDMQQQHPPFAPPHGLPLGGAAQGRAPSPLQARGGGGTQARRCTRCSTCGRMAKPSAGPRRAPVAGQPGSQGHVVGPLQAARPGAAHMTAPLQAAPALQAAPVPQGHSLAQGPQGPPRGPFVPGPAQGPPPWPSRRSLSLPSVPRLTLPSAALLGQLSAATPLPENIYRHRQAPSFHHPRPAEHPLGTAYCWEPAGLGPGPSSAAAAEWAAGGQKHGAGGHSAGTG